MRAGLPGIASIAVFFGAALAATSLAFIVATSPSGDVRVTVASGSMRPVIPTGSSVAIAKVPVFRLRPGAIIAFTPPRPFPQVVVVHEVASLHRLPRGQTEVITRGVANRSRDPWTLLIGAGATVGVVRVVVTPVERGLLAIAEAAAFGCLALASGVFIAEALTARRKESLAALG